MMREASPQTPSALTFSLLGVFLLTLTGCIDVEQTLILNSDGSGTIHMVYGVSEQGTAQMQELARSMQEAGGSDAEPMSLDFNDDDIRNDFKEYVPYGVALESVKTESRDGWKYRTLVITFRDLQGLAESGFLSDQAISLVKDGDGNYIFTQSSSSNGESMLPADEMDPFTAKLMKGFRAVLRVRPPTRILRTNAQQKNEREAAWVFDLNEDSMALKNMQGATMQVVFDGKGVNIAEFRSGKMVH